ncbi:hypothetical protein CW304_12105 [Bacillus sp. UFRGS-B20]|nr:hypothetical protein CW304_12105 [Bacillus sp. UFRGS-B20]
MIPWTHLQPIFLTTRTNCRSKKKLHQLVKYMGTHPLVLARKSRIRSIVFILHALSFFLHKEKTLIRQSRRIRVFSNTFHVLCYHTCRSNGTTSFFQKPYIVYLYETH